MMINLLDRAKLLFRKDKELCLFLYDILGFYPHNTELYRIALAHKSSEYRNRKGRPLNNERLEFLGDAILEAVVSDIVFHRYERRREGFLTTTRSKVVQRETLNRLAKEIGLERLIQTNAHNNAHNSYLGGNAFEALFGAVYLDRGYKACKWFIEHRIIGTYIDLDGMANKEVNFKSKLLEWSQKNRIRLEFTLDSDTSNNGNSPDFHSLAKIEDLVAGEGRGYSKKESQQKAAKEALTKLRREPQFIERIFAAKEQRTAMEAEEVAALPKIDEIEEAIRREKNGETSANETKPAEAPKRRPRRAARAAAAKPAPTAAKPAEKGNRGEEKPENRKKAAENKEKPAENKNTTGETTEVMTVETTNSRRRRRNRRTKPENRTETIDEAAAAKEREALIRAAEEQAFKEHAE